MELRIHWVSCLTLHFSCWRTVRRAGLLACVPLLACGDPACPSTNDQDCDGWLQAEDCDDLVAGVNPQAVEVCDGIDNNCDGLIDEYSTMRANSRIGAWADRKDVGMVATSLGDLNGDGLVDLALADDGTGEADSFVSIFMSPYPTGATIGEPLTEIRVTSGNSNSSHPQLSGGSDLTGDGWNDLVVGNSYFYDDTFNGAVYVLPGPTFTVTDIAEAPIWSLDVGHFFGNTVTGTADVTGDGHNDLLVGNPSDTDDCAILVFDSPLPMGNLTSADATKISCTPTEEEKRFEVRFVGDVTGDGTEDVASYSSSTNYDLTGVVSIWNGPILGEMTAADVVATVGTQPYGGSAKFRAGGDVNGDGVNDLALKENVEIGDNIIAATLIFLGPLSGPYDPGDASILFVRREGEADIDDIDMTTDFNGDGLTDVVVVRDGHEVPDGFGNFGYMGLVQIYLSPLNSREYLEDAEISIVGSTWNQLDHVHVFSPGNLGGDSHPDLLIGAPEAEDVGGYERGDGPGAVYLFYDPTACPLEPAPPFGNGPVTLPKVAVGPVDGL